MACKSCGQARERYFVVRAYDSNNQEQYKASVIADSPADAVAKIRNTKHKVIGGYYVVIDHIGQRHRYPELEL